MALTNMGFNDKIGLILEDQNRREREGRGKERRRGRRREERKKERSSSKIKGMETELKYGIVWIYRILRPCMVNILYPNLGF